MPWLLVIGNNKVIYDFLKIRSEVNKKAGGGRKYMPLSKVAKNSMLTEKLSKSFWRKLETEYDGLTRNDNGMHNCKELAVECID